ncbi:RNA recognition motif domain-containing protein [Taibaiella koreensis]|uniref:RNA recognition motif domain-containing protein n=1 Tax=Taibaiella koreensis TaxID=1268548 RepID=UPI000E59FC32|nr:RNA-binding protein [Taibaiella koreensis]
MNILIRNLAAIAIPKQLRYLFAEFGLVNHALIIREGMLAAPRIFGLVIMTNEADGLNAIKKLDQSKFMQQIILVNRALLMPAL